MEICTKFGWARWAKADARIQLSLPSMIDINKQYVMEFVCQAPPSVKCRKNMYVWIPAGRDGGRACGARFETRIAHQIDDAQSNGISLTFRIERDAIRLLPNKSFLLMMANGDERKCSSATWKCETTACMCVCVCTQLNAISLSYYRQTDFLYIVYATNDGCSPFRGNRYQSGQHLDGIAMCSHIFSWTSLIPGYNSSYSSVLRNKNKIK